MAGAAAVAGTGVGTAVAAGAGGAAAIAAGSDKAAAKAGKGDRRKEAALKKAEVRMLLTAKLPSCTLVTSSAQNVLGLEKIHSNLRGALVAVGRLCRQEITFTCTAHGLICLTGR